MRAAVVGTTSWGTTLALVLARNGVAVDLVCRSREEAEAIRAAGENPWRLRGFQLPDQVTPVAEDDFAGGEVELAVFAVPSAALSQNAARLRGRLSAETVVVSATKGLEEESGRRMTAVLGGALGIAPERLVALSGPNLSREIALGLPAATVAASISDAAAGRSQDALMSSALRVYTSDDVVGVELAGALKNVVAVGAGIIDGLELGDNAKSGFIARGLAEITRLGVAAGANPLTFGGLAGLGDLMATCASLLSRNRHVGVKIARGRPLAEVLSTMDQVAEGVPTTHATLVLARRHGIEMPIAETLARVLFEGLEPRCALAELMGRPRRGELA